MEERKSPSGSVIFCTFKYTDSELYSVVTEVGCMFDLDSVKPQTSHTTGNSQCFSLPVKATRPLFLLSPVL